MSLTFVETPWFTRRLKVRLDDDRYREFQRVLLGNPDLGAVMPGCGGLRKARVADPNRGQGKRGGIRIIYLHLPEVSYIALIDIYGKDEKDDLTPQDKRAFADLARRIRQSAVTSSKRS